jgi:acyl-CoA synthetase (AMP-forming)/AMP-acid ligase II
MIHRSRNIAELFCRSAELFGARPAVSIGTDQFTYFELFERAKTLADVIRNDVIAQPCRIGLLASPGVCACVAILGGLMSGGVIVPLNPKFPIDRIRTMVTIAGTEALMVEEDHASLVQQIVATVGRSLRVLLVSMQTHFSGSRARSCTQVIERVSSNAPAYVLFTSGSTGVPKAVELTHLGILTYLANIGRQFQICASDRISHNFELTFDLSIHDLFRLAERAFACRGASTECHRCVS